MQRFQSGEFRYTNVKAVLICLNPFNVNFHFYGTSLTTDYQLGEIRTQSFKVYSLKMVPMKLLKEKNGHRMLTVNNPPTCTPSLRSCKVM